MQLQQLLEYLHGFSCLNGDGSRILTISPRPKLRLMAVTSTTNLSPSKEFATKIANNSYSNMMVVSCDLVKEIM